MNCITLSGNLCKDIRLYSLESGKEIVENTIAVPRERKNEEGIRESDFINIKLFGSRAKYLSDYGKKGDKIEIQGSIRMESYRDKEDNYKINTYVIVDKVQILTSRPKNVEKPF